ncbi:MAG: hypothetical protein ACK5NK_02395 [Niabella sp.]
MVSLSTPNNQYLGGVVLLGRYRELYAIQFGVSKTIAFRSFVIPYLIGLFVWVLVVVFITLQLS